MTTVELRKVKSEKMKLRRSMKNYRVTVREVASRTEYHEQTVKSALSPDQKYWNQSIVDVARQILAERRNYILNNIGEKQ